MKIIANTMTVCVLLCNQKHVVEEEVQIPAVPAASPGATSGIGSTAGDGGYSGPRGTE